MMTYIELLNRLWHANKTERFSIGERELYYYLLNECNKNYWRMPVSCPTSVICTVTGLNKQTLMRARDSLKKRGFIDYTEGIQNSKAPTYIIIMDKDEFVTANVTGCVTAAKTASVTSNKDKDNIITDKSRLNDFLSIDELERKLTEDTVWQNHILSHLSNSGATIDASMLQKFLQDFFRILENFCLCLIQRTLGELPNFGVMIWQLYYMLRSALICFQVTRFRNKGNHFI